MRILIIDDDPLILRLYRHYIEQERWTAILATTIEAGKLAIARNPDCIVLDYMFRGRNGIHFLHQIKEHPPILFISGGLTDELRREAEGLGVAMCLEKSSLDREGLINAIRKIVRSTP